MHKTPLVSIIIPTYNRAHLIGETLESVIAQTYVNWECVVVDDGSTDNTSEILKLYCEKDNRIQYHHRPESYKPGGNGARNYGFELSKGEYVNWLDSDDFISKNKIKLQVLALQQYPEANLLTCSWGKATSVNKFAIKELGIYKNYTRGIDLIKDYGIYKTYFASHVFLVNKDLVYKSGLWNENLLINQDGEFFTRILINTKQIVFVKKAYALYREPDADNVSAFSSKLKAKHAIISWQLIAQYLELIDANFFYEYVNFSKNAMFGKVKSTYPLLINEYKCFFKEQIKRDKSIKLIVKKLIGRFKHILKKVI